jgi:adenosylhomocysteine nucleosidase
MATMTEAKPLIMGLALAEIENQPFRVFKDSRIALVISGIGKVNAAMASVWLIENFRPSLICNIGAAGALGERGQLGDIYHISKVTDPDRPDLETGVPMEYVPDVLEGFPEMSLATHDRPLRSFEERNAAAGLADLVDMEGAAVVQAAHRFGLRCFIFKFVSDTPKHTSRGDIIENIGKLRDLQLRFFEDRVLPALQKAGIPNQ